MKIETVSLILEPTVLIILSFLKAKDVEERTVKDAEGKTRVIKI